MKIFRKAVKDKELGASLTVECALVLPLFMFFILSVVYLTGLFRFESLTASSMMQAAAKTARDSYVGEAALPAGGDKLAESLVSAVSVRSILRARLGEELKETGGVFPADTFTEKDKVIMNGTWKYSVPFNIFGIGDFPVIQKVKARKWTGYDIRENEKEEETVYITKTGTVYHRSPNCTHIKLDIRNVPSETLSTARNNDGSKYYPCDICVKKNKAAGNVYITREGTCYHNRADCMGLKRSVKAVPISKVGARRPCSRCGGK